MYSEKLHFYFIGIGGSGMSGLAEIMLAHGFKVSGSDLKASAVTRHLENKGAKIYFEHSAGNIKDAVTSVVYSSAIADDNPEMIEAKSRGLTVVQRADLLAELMRFKYSIAVAGSHGKTSTSSMIACILEAAELDPTVIIGGIVHQYSSTAKYGKKDFLVAEADESDRSFLKLHPTLAVVTNIDDEHIDAYADLDDLKNSFREFIEKVPFYAAAVLCYDNPMVRELAKDLKSRVISYSINDSTTSYYARLIKQSSAGTTFELYERGVMLGEISLPMLGEHFMQNSLSAIAIARELDIDFSCIVSALADFKGVSRRLETLKITEQEIVINDYAHHPTEITASVQALRNAYQDARLHVVFQPHRYSRTKACWNDFSKSFKGVDHLYLSDIYAAGEAEIAEINSENLLSTFSQPKVVSKYCGSLENCLAEYRQNKGVQNILVFMGAGSVGAYAQKYINSQD